MCWARRFSVSPFSDGCLLWPVRKPREPSRTASSAMPRPRMIQSIYGQQCASCHGNALEGAQAPPLRADGFISRWQNEPLSSLVSKIQNTMPADRQGSLTRQQSADLVAHILKTGGFPAAP